MFVEKKVQVKKKRDSKKQIVFRRSKMNRSKIKWDPAKQSDPARQMSRSHEKKNKKNYRNYAMQWMRLFWLFLEYIDTVDVLHVIR